MYDTSKRIDATLLEGSHDIKLSRRELGILLRHMSIMFASIDEPNRNTWYEDDFGKDAIVYLYRKALATYEANYDDKSDLERKDYATQPFYWNHQKHHKTAFPLF